MAHWAEVDENNIVLRVTVGDNNDPDEGYKWLVDNLGGRWLQTSYNTHANQHANGGTPFRGNYAAEGYSYDEALDIFLPPQPYPSWLVDEETASWVAPIPYPDDGVVYAWDEEAGDWVAVDFQSDNNEVN